MEIPTLKTDKHGFANLALYNFFFIFAYCLRAVKVWCMINLA